MNAAVQLLNACVCAVLFATTGDLVYGAIAAASIAVALVCI